jgi:hypothetical protein
MLLIVSTNSVDPVWPPCPAMTALVLGSEMYLPGHTGLPGKRAMATAAGLPRCPAGGRAVCSELVFPAPERGKNLGAVGQRRLLAGVDRIAQGAVIDPQERIAPAFLGKHHRDGGLP